MELFIIVLLLVFIAYILFETKKTPDFDNNQTKNKEEPKSSTESKQDYEFNYNYNYMPFAKGYLLTKTERTFFIILVREALKRQLLVCPKVRLEDIIFVTEKKYREQYRGYIKSRHVDFVLLDKACNTVAAIELDDPSHNTEKAMKTDQFKNELFYKVGIPLIRICTGTDYIKEINYAFDELNFPKAEPRQTQP